MYHGPPEGPEGRQPQEQGLEAWLQQRGYASLHTLRMNTLAWDTSALELVEWESVLLADVVDRAGLEPAMLAGGLGWAGLGWAGLGCRQAGARWRLAPHVLQAGQARRPPAVLLLLLQRSRSAPAHARWLARGKGAGC
jgi:hypothetical protein